MCRMFVTIPVRTDMSPLNDLRSLMGNGACSGNGSDDSHWEKATEVLRTPLNRELLYASYVYKVYVRVHVR